MEQGYFPRQDIPEAKKTENNMQFFKDCIDYGVQRHFYYRGKRDVRLRRMYNDYNGLIDETKLWYLNKTYGPDNIIKYVAYRLSNTELDNLVGQQLQMPLNGTVYVTNPNAQVAKLEDVAAIVGMHHAPDEAKKLKGIGVDLFGGMTPPTVGDGDTIFDTISPKSKNEMVMQYIVNQQVPDMGLKLKLNENFRDVVLTSECYGKYEINADGDVVFRPILAPNAIFEESENDPFLDKSPYIGEQRMMFAHDILREYQLNKLDADKLAELARNPAQVTSGDYAKNYDTTSRNLGILVYTIEWIGIEIKYLKTYVDKNGETKTAEMSSDYYAANKGSINNEIKNNKYKLDVKYKFVLYEATRIGHEIYVNMGKVKNMPASLYRPSWTMRRYQAFHFNTVGGVRVSMKQKTEKLDEAYNLVMWQINREMAKGKGKVLTYDLAYLPKSKTIEDVMYNIVNDGLLLINTAADGNVAGKDSTTAAGFRSEDIGISQSLNILFAYKMQLEDTVKKVLGIAPARMGDIPASSTVGNTQQQMASSLTTTAPLFYYFNQYVERGMKLTLELSKISWGILKPEKGEMILGADGMRMLRVTEDICFDDYGYSLGDVQKEMNIRQILRQYMPAVLQAEPTLIHMAIKAELAETFTEAEAIVEKAMAEVNRMQQQQQQDAHDQQMQQIQAQNQGAQQLQQGAQQHDMNMLAAKTITKNAENTQKAMNQTTHETAKAGLAPQQKGK